MSESISFTSTGFSLESVTVPAPASIAVRYTYAPLQSSPSGPNDALNPSNYSLVGPTPVAITGIAADPGDIQTVVLTLTGPMGPGVWMLTASASIETPTAVPLAAPRSFTFTVTSAATPPPINPGVVDTGPEDFLRVFLSKALQGQAWTALIAALGTGDQTNWDNAETAFDQLFITSASGSFLDRRLSDDGIRRPPGIGLGDSLFRQLGISLRNNQLTQEAFLEALEIFYGTDAVRAYAETAVGQPYAINDGDDLHVLIDGVDAFPITFQAADFTLIGQATATEVAVAITRGIRTLGQSQAFAIPFTNPQTGVSTVRIYSGAIGLRSTVQVVGGRSQNALLFPEQLPLPVAGTVPSTLVWDVNTVVPLLVPKAPPNVMRVYLAGGTMDLTQVRAGDYVNIYGQNFQPQNRGSFPILDVVVTYDSTGSTLIQYFDVQNFNVSPQSGVAEFTLDDVRFYRPLKSTIQAESGRTVVVSQSTADACDVIIPATTLAVTRTIDTGAYLHQAAPLVNASAPAAWPITRDNNGVVTVTAPGHGLSVGAQIYVDNIVPSLVLPTPITGSLATSGNPGTTDASPISEFITIREGDQLSQAWFSASTALPNTDVSLSNPNVTALQTGGNVSGLSITTCETLQLATPPAVQANDGYQWTYNWVATAALPVALERHAIVAPTQGNNLGGAVVAGGVTITSGPVLTFSNGIYSYNPTSNTWATAPITLAVARSSLTAQLLGNGQMVVAGGAVGTNVAAVANTDITDANQAVISSTPSLITARAEHQAATITNAQGQSMTMVIGGRSLALPSLNDVLVLALWRFDETSGSTAADSGFNSYGYTLTATGTTIVPGKIGDARSFNGSTDVMKTNNSGGSGPRMYGIFGGPFTVECWVNGIEAGTPGAWQTIFAFEGVTDVTGNGNCMAEFDVMYQAGTITFGFENQVGTSVQTISGTGTVGPVAYDTSVPWHHVAMTTTLNLSNTAHYDYHFYLDGQLVGTVLNQPNGGSSNSGSTSNAYVGNVARTLPLSGPFAGSIDDLRVSGPQPVPFLPVIPGKSLASRLPPEFYLTWLRGRGDLLTPGNGQLLASTETFTQGAFGWASSGSMAYARSGHRVVALPDGRILVTGGYAYKNGQQGNFATSRGVNAVTASCELYDPQSQTWKGSGMMSTPRANHMAVYIPETGKVMVWGGYSDNAGTAAAPRYDLWDPATGLWSIGPTSIPTTNATLLAHEAGLVMSAQGSPVTYTELAFVTDGINVDYATNLSHAPIPEGAFVSISDGTTTLDYVWPSTGISGTLLGVSVLGFFFDINTGFLVVTFSSLPGSGGVITVTYEKPGAWDSTFVWTAGAPGLGFVQGSDQVSGGGLEGWQTVSSVLNVNFFQYETPAYPQYTRNAGLATVITPFKAPPAGKVPGPYIWDTTGSTPGITSVQAQTAVDLFAGQQYDQLPLSTALVAEPATLFPNEPGFLVLNFGSDQAVFPLPYLGMFSDTSLSLDYTFVMPFDVPAGSSVTLIIAKGVYVPQVPEAAGSFYLTDSNAGRISAEGTVEAISAGGLNVDITIAYPGDRGLGGEGLPATGQKFSDKVLVWGSNDLDVDELDAREGINLQVSEN